MTEYTKPLPIPDEDTEPFFEACKRHELQMQKCDACGKVRFEPGPICPGCLSDKFTWERLSGNGTVYTFSVVHHSYYPGFKGELPYVIAVVVLDEGPRILTNILDCKAEDVKIDMPVKVTFKDCTDEITLPYFVPA